MKKQAPYLAPFLLLGLLLVFPAAFPEALEAVRLRFFDSLQQLHPRPYTPAPVRIVDIDDESLARFGQWPWPRTLVAEMIRKIDEAGAAVIALDIVFAEPDRTSPQNMLRLWQQAKIPVAAPEEIGNWPDHDQFLADAFRESRVITAFSIGGKAAGQPPRHPAGFAFGGDNPKPFLPDFEGWVKSLPVLEEAAAGNGIVNFFPEYDTLIRRIPLFFDLEQAANPYPAISIEALRVFQNASTYKVKSSGAHGEQSFGASTGIVSVQVGRLIIPTDAHGRMWLYDSGPIPQRSVPAWQVLEQDLGPGALKDTIVFIGTSAMGLKDLRNTPLNPAAAGVEVHAQLAEQALTSQYLYRPDWAAGAEFVFLLVLSLLLIFSMPRLGAAWCAVLGALCFSGIFAGSWYAFRHHQWLLDPLVPSASAMLIYLTSSLIHFLKTDSEKRQVRSAFSRYLAPSLVEQLAEHPEQLRLGGEMREMSVLFGDLHGFTAMSEGLSPEALTQFMNGFLTPMTEVILKHQGTIDKYMGDCIMAFWNAPLDDAEHASHSCEAALQMQQYLREHYQTYKLKLGIGINSGPCCVGNMGSEQRFDYSVLGDTVNLASRLEGLCRIYRVDIMTGQTIKEAAQDFCFLEVDQVRVKGKAQASRIYTLLGNSSLLHHQNFQLLVRSHLEMLAAYRRQEWASALKLAKECQKIQLPSVNLSEFYAYYQERIEAGKVTSPGEDWDGITVLTVK